MYTQGPKVIQQIGRQASLDTYEAQDHQVV